MTFRRTKVFPKAERKGHFDRGRFEEGGGVAGVVVCAVGVEDKDVGVVMVEVVVVVVVVVVVAAAKFFASSTMSGSVESVRYERRVERSMLNGPDSSFLLSQLLVVFFFGWSM